MLLLSRLISSHKEAREPRFPMEICDRTFELARVHLAALDYHGPVALACDDTKLFATLRLYWDKKEGSYFLVGACCGPIRVPNLDAAQKAVADTNVIKATKVCDMIFDNSGILIIMTCPDSLVVYDNPCRWSRTNPPCGSSNL